MRSNKIIDLYNFILNVSDSNGDNKDIGVVAITDSQAMREAKAIAKKRYGFKNPKVNYIDYNNVDERFKLRYHFSYGKGKDKIEVIKT